MKILNAKLDGLTLSLSIDRESLQEARKFIYGFRAGLWEIIKAKKKRSLDANAFCWSICQQIGQALGISKEEIYRRALRDGNSFEILIMRKDTVDSFARHWQSNGIGWFVVVESYRGEYATIHAYYGSSTFDTAEMSALIDSLLQEAESIGLVIMTERVESLLRDWDEQTNKGSIDTAGG